MTAGATMQPEKARSHSRLRLSLLAGLVLLLAVSCDSSHATSLDHAANLGDNAPVLFNSGTGIGLPNTKADTAARAVFLRPYNATRAPFMVGRGGSIFGCAGSFVPVDQSRYAPATPDWSRDGGCKPTKEATMPKLARALSRIFTAAHPVAHFPTESEAVLFARQYLAQTGRAVAVAPAVIGFDVIGGGV